MKDAEPRIVRCAIYTRKSTDEGLEQEFNSLDAQYDACRAFILSQRHEGWTAKPERYDDGGFSGGTLLRPALHRLLSDVDKRLIDMIVIYKIDRLTRSLPDFGKLVERFDDAGCSFASVTQSFNTSTSTGRLMLNVLLSFAQFEREVTAERIRDKIAASKQKGIWMGGIPPLGYVARERRLIVDEAEADRVRKLFALFKQCGCLIETWRLAKRSEIRARPSVKHSDGPTFRRSGIRWILTNPVYVGRIRHRAVTYNGQHEPIIDIKLWDEVQTLVRQYDANRRGMGTRGKRRSLLAGKLFDETASPLGPRFGRNGRRYYVSTSQPNPHSGVVTPWRVRAELVEAMVAHTIRKHLLESEAVRQIRLAKKRRRNHPAQTEAIGSPRSEPALPDLLNLVKQVRLRQGIMRTDLEPAKLAALLGVSLRSIPDEITKLSAPFQVRRSSQEARLLVGDCYTAVDQRLLRFVSQGFAWWKAILAGNSVANIARINRVSIRQVTIHLPSAFLAPDIVETIVDGRQPSSLTITALRSGALPTDWGEQRRLFGVTSQPT